MWGRLVQYPNEEKQMRIDAPDIPGDAGNDQEQRIVSRSGIRITLDNVDGQETILVSTPSGQSLMLRDGPGLLQITTPNGNSITMDPSGITFGTAGKCTVLASVVEISAGEVIVNAAMSSFSGIVKADTLVANSVVANSYTPGVGNIW